MIRRSISQIFESNSPHEQSSHLEPGMFSGLGGRRPTIQSPAPPPLNQQPPLPHTTSTSNSWVSSFNAQHPSPIHAQHTPFRPLSQIEAMPPNPPPGFKVPKVILDPARRHPVFFTDRLKKAPNGVVGGRESGVAEGYVWEEGTRDVGVGAGGGSRL